MAKSRLLLKLAIYSALGALLGGCASHMAQTTPVADDRSQSAAVSAGDLDFSFVFFGCNRVGWGDDESTPSTANAAQLEQTLKDISNLEQTAGLSAPPRYLFLLGDIVRNEVDDAGQTLASQLSGWEELWKQQPFSSSSIEPILLPGNHELLKSVKASNGDYYETPNPATNDKWLSWLAKNSFNPMAGNGPTPKSSPSDQLVDDNSKLTWSFSTPLLNGQNAHFVLINTDTLSSARTNNSQCLQDPSLADSPLPGWVPANWVNKDIARAEHESSTDMIFAFGHKPITTPKGSDTVGRANILNCDDYQQANSLQQIFQDNSKFVGYLAAHLHQWDYTMLGENSQRQVPQVVAGNGGSPLSDGDIFGFTLVKVFKNGKVTATSFGRDAPEPYYSSNSGGAATARETVVLREGRENP